MAKLVCYCFEYTVDDIRRDVEINGRSRILEQIKAARKLGHCQCAVKHPKGR